MTTAKKETTGPSTLELLKGEAKDALWQSGSRNFSKAIKRGIVTVLKNAGAFGKGSGKGAVRKAAAAASAFEEVLDSPIGDIFVQGFIGFGLMYVPHFKDDPRVIRLAKENRIGAMRDGMDQFMGVAMEHFMPALQGALQALPEVNEETIKVRVTTDSEDEAATEHQAETEAEEAVKTKKTLKA